MYVAENEVPLFERAVRRASHGQDQEREGGERQACCLTTPRTFLLEEAVRWYFSRE